MIIILCTIPLSQYNDDVVEGLIHFGIRANLNECDYFYASFHPETQEMEIIRRDHSKSNLNVHPIKNHSIRYSCVYTLIHMLGEGGWLMANQFSDLADHPDEAKELYFYALSQRVRLSFYDSSYLDTDVLVPDLDPSADQKEMIGRLIDNYYTQLNKDKSSMANEEISKLSYLTNAKKKSAS